MKIEAQRDRIASFRHLELLAHQVVEGFISGMHKSPFHGFSAEFAEHKVYNAGESTKHIDWKLFAKTDRLYTKKFEEETNLLNADGILTLKGHYMTYYWQIRKEFLNYLEDSMTHDSLIGSTISTISKKNASYVSKISSPSILTENTEISKRSAKSNTNDFYPKNFNHAFLPKPDFEEYRRNARKDHDVDPDYLAEDGHPEPDHPSTFSKCYSIR